MFQELEETAVQVAGVLVLSPLVAGIYEKAKARVEGRKGPSILQPFYDLRKLIRKETLIPETSSSIFVYAPYLAMGIYIVISFVIPVVYPEPIYLTPTVDFLGGAILFSLAAFVKTLGALDSGSNFAALGVSRALSFSYFSEATLITVFFGVALITGTDNPYITLSYLVKSPSNYLEIDHVLITIAFFMLWLFETGKLPVESSGLSEMGMIDGGLTYEYSGRDLALMEYTSMVKQYLLGSVFLNVFAFPWFMQIGTVGALEDVPIMLGKWMLLIAVTVIINTSLAKLRLYKVQDFLAVAFILSLVSLVITVVGDG
jgi:formate hydrogenlyase subunit 4